MPGNHFLWSIKELSKVFKRILQIGITWNYRIWAFNKSLYSGTQAGWGRGWWGTGREQTQVERMPPILLLRNNPLPKASPPPTSWLTEGHSMILVDECGNPYPPLKSFAALGGVLFVSVVRINPVAFHMTEEDTSPIFESMFSCFCFKNQVEISYPKFYPIKPSAKLRGSIIMRKYTCKYVYFIKRRLYIHPMILCVLKHIHITWHLILMTAIIYQVHSALSTLPPLRGLPSTALQGGYWYCSQFRHKRGSSALLKSLS